jgi:hypothetical protein
MPTISNLLHSLDAAIATVQASLARQMGDATACQLHKDGRVTGGLKYDEGRLVALSNLRRTLRRQEGATPAGLDAALAAERAEWQELLARHQAAAKPSLPWVAYAQGGLDALDALSTKPFWRPFE